MRISNTFIVLFQKWQFRPILHQLYMFLTFAVLWGKFLLPKKCVSSSVAMFTVCEKRSSSAAFCCGVHVLCLVLSSASPFLDWSTLSLRAGLFLAHIPHFLSIIRSCNSQVFLILNQCVRQRPNNERPYDIFWVCKSLFSLYDVVKEY